MAVTGQISVARVGRSVQIFEQTSDIIDVFDPNAAPELQAGDHVSLYPGDFRNDLEQDGPITIPQEVFVTILPGAVVGVESVTGPIQQRYTNIDGAVANIADLNIANQYTTQVERQSSRVRVYPEDTQNAGVEVPFRGFGTLEAAAREAESGDSIIVFPGVYSPEVNLFLDGIDWHFMNGTIVEYRKENFGGAYPHALFDDKRDIDGNTDISGGSECNVYGEAEFRIGTENPQDTVQNSGDFWDDWNLYGLLALNADSFMDFNARKVLMQENADAALKISSGQDVNIGIDEVEIDSSIAEQYNVPKTGKIPAFCVFNGTETRFTSDGFGDFNIDVGRFVVRERQDQTLDPINAYFISTLEQGEYNNQQQRRVPFQGTVDMSLDSTRIEISQDTTEFILISNGFSPERFVLGGTELSENNAGIIINGTTTDGNVQLPVTTVVVKESTISTKGTVDEPPIDLRGESGGFDLNITETFLITGEDEDFDAIPNPQKYSIINNTGDTNFNIKFYGSCFADMPVQDYQQILHPELNDIQWTQEAELLS